MMRITNKSKNFWLDLGTKIGNFFAGQKSKESNLQDFCRAEYKSDWYWAYSEYQRKGKFPSVYKRAA